MRRRVSGRKIKLPLQMYMDNVPEKAGVYYIERGEVKQALRVIAAKQGHNSIGRVLREATIQYLKANDPEGKWKIASNDD